MNECALSLEEDIKLKKYCEGLGVIYLCTPFSREAANRLNKMNVEAFKIGSGECNNYPLIKHIASFGKPIILSTGMNDLDSVRKAVNIIEEAKVPYALLHCTSLYPTPYEKARLNAILEMKKEFPNAVIGLSDHSVGNYACFGAVALGASILEKHFTSEKSWAGPDIALSIDPTELKDLIKGSDAVHKALQGEKGILPEEQPTIDFAYSSIVSIKNIKPGEKLTTDNIWVKRPGKGGIRAEDFEKVLGKTAKKNIFKDTQLLGEDFG
jgi:N-acetylneuraminate synthase